MCQNYELCCATINALIAPHNSLLYEPLKGEGPIYVCMRELA